MTPASSFWHADVSGLPVHPQSAALDREHRRDGRAQGRLRRGPVERRADRDPLHDRARDAAARAGLVHVRRRERPRPVPDPAERPDRGRRRARPATATSSSSTATRAGCGSSTARIRRTAARRGRPARARPGTQLERDAPARVDVRRRRRAADPAGPRALRRGRGRRDRPRHPLHGSADRERLRLAGEPQGRDRRRVGSADGRLVPAEGELRHQRLLGARTR